MPNLLAGFAPARFTDAKLPPRPHADRRRAKRAADDRPPMPGRLLVREYRGRQVVVKVLEDGFGHADRRYSSLTAIAQEVTGTKRNNFLFLGLTGRNAADAKR